MVVSSSVKLWEALSIPLNKLIHFSYIPFQISFTDWQTLVYPFVQCVTSLDKTSISWSLYLIFFNLLWDSYIFLQVQQFELHTVYQCRRTLVLQNQRKIFCSFSDSSWHFVTFFFFKAAHEVTIFQNSLWCHQVLFSNLCQKESSSGSWWNMDYVCSKHIILCLPTVEYISCLFVGCLSVTASEVCFADHPQCLGSYGVHSSY